MITSKKRFLAFILSLLIVISSLPISIFATQTATESKNYIDLDSSTIAINSEEENGNEIIGETIEIESLREENVKHFRLANGTFEAVIYSEPVHRKDQNGIWQDIDNSLSLNTINGKQGISTTDHRIQFSNEFKSTSPIFLLNENGYSISMNLIDNNETVENSSTVSKKISSTTPTINNFEKSSNYSTNSFEKNFKINNKSSILYNNVRTNIDIEYILQGNDLKENIIVNAPCDNYEFMFYMQLNGLSAELDEIGNIIIVDSETKETKYIIPAPYMYDNAGVYSTDVYYDLQFKNDGQYILKVIANDNWLNSSERSYPIVIDPSISKRSTVWDSYTFSSFPDDNFGFDEDLWVSDSHTSYIRMNLPKLPNEATFNNAYLYISHYATVNSGSLLAGAYQILEFWSESEITYNNSPQISTTRLSTSTLTASTTTTESSPGVASFRITSAAKSWYDNTSPNYGIAIKREASTTHTNTHAILKSYEANDDDYAYISVNYTYYIPDGVYALKSYSSSRWITIEDDSPWAGNNLQQEELTNSPASESIFDRSSLFKISRVGNSNQYIIRSMLNNNLSFGISGTEIITKTIPCSDDAVANADTFFIEWDGYGFNIRPYGSNYLINMSSTSTAALSTIAKNNASSNARWNLVQYTGVHKRGSVIYHPSVLNAGTTVEFTPVTWATDINYNTPNLTVASGYEEYATSSWNESTLKGTFTLHDNGTLIVSSKIYNGDQTSNIPLTHIFTLTLVIDEGAYYFKNKEVGKYMQIDDNDEPDYSTSGELMELWDFDGGDYQKWNLIHLNDGYYKIISFKSGMALSVQSGCENDSAKALVQESYSDVGRKQWKITKSSSGAYVLRPKSGESYDTDWCMCAGNQFLWVTDGLNVEQRSYDNNDIYKDEWELELFPQFMQLEAQEQNNWCWAASARMSSFNYMDSEISQASAAVFIKLGIETSTPTSTEITDANIGATVGETERTIEYILGSNNCYSTWGEIYDENTLQDLLDCSNPVVILRGWYNWNGKRQGGHFVVIYDYYWDSVNDLYMYRIFDPWDVNVGESYDRSYQSICDGRNPAFDEDRTDTGLWEGIVVYTNGDYQNTIAWPAP